MTVDDKMQEFADRLGRRVAEHRAQQERDSAELAALYRQADAEQQARTQTFRTVPFDRQLKRRTAPGGRFAAPLQARIALSQTDVLQRLDQMMWAAFALDHAFPDQPLRRYPVVYCETLEEFLTPIVADEDCSESARDEMLREWAVQIEEKTSETGGGILGVNLPGRGCFINGWLFGFANGTSARAALEDKRTFLRILETACHEKLGHGLIAEVTAAGREKSDLGLYRFGLARQFSLRTVDTPRSALLRQKHMLIYETTKFTEEGWATWIEGYMLWRAAQDGLLADAGAPAQPDVRYTLEQVGQVLQAVHDQSPDDLRPEVEKFLEATRILLVVSEPLPDDAIFWAVRVWQEKAEIFDQVFSHSLGQPALYVLGYLLLRRLEARLGWQNLPCAVAIAANVTYDLEQISLVDLGALVTSDPRLNVDARLALLGTLGLEPGQGTAELARQAREELSLAVPEGW